MPIPAWPDLRLVKAARGARRKARRALAGLESLFSDGTPPEAIAASYGLEPAGLAILERLASAPDAWRPIPAIIPEHGTEEAQAALAGLCLHGLILARPWRRSVRLTDAGRYILILCSAGGRHPRECLHGSAAAPQGRGGITDPPGDPAPGASDDEGSRRCSKPS